MPLTLVAARETADGERRTPLVPETAKKFAALGAKLRLESNASLKAISSTAIMPTPRSRPVWRKPMPAPMSSCASRRPVMKKSLPCRMARS